MCQRISIGNVKSVFLIILFVAPDSLHDTHRIIQKMETSKAELSERFDKINNRDVQIAADIQQTNKKRKKTQEQLEEEKKRVSVK